jgi:hypothetical protein
LGLDKIDGEHLRHEKDDILKNGLSKKGVEYV